MVKQRDKARAKANKVRLGRSKIKRDLKAGRIALADALSAAVCEAQPVWELVECLHGYGPLKTQRALGNAGVGFSVVAGGLTDRQRVALGGLAPARSRA